ncbi:MAG: rod shape-determining protein [Blastocatellia bacterium]|nr:rod shape-determining protein [Blastocatellia bacterium]
MYSAIVSGLRRAFADPDVAIDLGTANTRMYALGRGLIADEPSLVKVSSKTGVVEAVGARAADLAKNELDTVSPLRAGVIADLSATVSLLQPLLSRAKRFGIIKPRALACAPTDACESEREALIEATRRAGASSVVIAPEPIAAAIGMGLDITSPYAQMLVDIGDGVTDIAVIRSSKLVKTVAIRKACSDLHKAVRNMAEQNYGLLLSLHEAERLTCEIGTLVTCISPMFFKAVGTDAITGKERAIEINNHEVYEAMNPVIATIIKAIKELVRDLPHSTACEVIENGVCLTGGGARLNGLAKRIEKETLLDIKLAADPLRAVINGAKQMLAAGLATSMWMGY